jgi:cbb3-type cytochrome oxidase subunit 3
MQSILITASIVVALAAIVGVIWYVLRTQRRERIQKSLNSKLLLIRLPQQQSTNKDGTKATGVAGFKDEINLSEQLFSILTSGKESVTFEVAVHHVGEEIHFYVSVPEKMVQFVSRQIEGLFKDAQITPVSEYNIFQPNGINAGFYLAQDNHYALPLRTYIESEIDTFSPIVSGLSKISEIGEGAALQIIVKPAPENYKKTIFSIVNELRKGEPFKKVASKYFMNLKSWSYVLKEQKPEDKNKPSIVDEESIKALEKKVSKPLVKVNFRVLISSLNQFQTEMLLDSIGGSFGQFEAPLKNKLKIVKVKNFQKLAYQFSFREYDESQTMILNTEELASLFHLPTSTTLSTRIKWIKSKEAPPPSDLSEEGTPIGESNYRGTLKVVRIAENDRRRHVYSIGQTGTGKTTFMVNMILDDIKKGKGVCYIDPHGDAIDTISGLIPKERFDDVIIFEPGYTKKPLGLNMLEYDFNRPEEKTFIVNEIQGIFNRLFLAETMGPMFEQYMRNALLLLMEDAVNEPATFVEVPRIFTDEEFRRKKLERITNPVVIDFWTKEAIKVGGEASLANMAPYITSKFNNFIANDFLRPIIGQEKSAFNFRQIMDEGKILLVNLSKGKIGDINAGLLGMIITGKLLMSALSRVDVEESKRRDFYLYIDEFQNFTTDSISTILSEARKYRLNLSITHQFIAQLDEKIRDSVFGNVGSMIAFRVGAQDAEFLIKQFEPIFSQQDLMNIDNFNAYAKILINNQTSKPFNIRMTRYPTPDSNLIQQLKEMSFSKYGRERSEVEKDILARLRA